MAENLTDNCEIDSNTAALVTTQATRRVLTIPAAEIRVGDVFNLGEQAMTVVGSMRFYGQVKMWGRDESTRLFQLNVPAGLRFTVTREVA